ncbi:MAG: hypothetical protein VX246_15295 [Myxococcota bacterium]|nr:hypothetical protein [Myxococcota bacterium]
MARGSPRKPRTKRATASGVQPPPIAFGTGGWRGVLGEEITEPRLCALVHGVASWLRSRRVRGAVLVGFDGRSDSERLAGLAVEVLRARGLRVVRDVGRSSTPAVAGAVVPLRASAAIVLTASHNAPRYHGLKLFGTRGEAVGGEAAKRVEASAARALGSTPGPAAQRGKLTRSDFSARYVKRLSRALTSDASRARRLRVFYDALHGAGAGTLDAALRQRGFRVAGMRLESDPKFGGTAPDPSPARLRDLARSVRDARGLRIGLATDGDADRITAVDEGGRVLGDSELAALLVDHLAASGRLRGGVALSAGSSSFVERVAERHALATSRHRLGFKHLSHELLSGAAEIAVDESGGVAFGEFAFDKDGMFAGAMLAESVACSGVGLGEQLRRLRAECGNAVAGRAAVASSPRRLAALERLLAKPLASFDGSQAREVDRSDGLRLVLRDGFVMWRASGTEPVIRIYAEAPGVRRLRERLAKASARLGVAR